MIQDVLLEKIRVVAAEFDIVLDEGIGHIEEEEVFRAWGLSMAY